MNLLRRQIAAKSLEHQLFLITLIVAVPYFIMNIIFDLLNEAYGVPLIIDVVFLAICLVMLQLQRSAKNRNILINIFCVLILFGFVFFWVSSGGINGAGPYVFPIILVLILLITSKKTSYIFAGGLVGLVFVLSSDLIPVNEEITYSGLVFDFFINLILVVVLMATFKRALDKEQTALKRQNKVITSLNRKLSRKAAEIELYNRDITAIKNNLEKVAARHTENLQRENQRIIEYSFINAHLVRAPLTNIMGLVDHVDGNANTEKIEELKANANNLDRVIRKLANILKR
ncbi:hypothetical protein [Ekhidna sp.]|uniref:hypothetical protein n=1 Tax=Ekhidna sp. TaxID=2608089 RepID=UPI003CCBEC31